MGAFSAKISTTPSGETIDGSQKRFRPKMMAQTTSITMQNFVEIARRTLAERMKCDVFHFFYLFFIFENNALGRRSLWCVVDLLSEDIASTFVGRFRRCLHLFCGRKEEKHFPAY